MKTKTERIVKKGFIDIEIIVLGAALGLCIYFWVRAYQGVKESDEKVRVFMENCAKKDGELKYVGTLLQGAYTCKIK